MKTLNTYDLDVNNLENHLREKGFFVVLHGSTLKILNQLEKAQKTIDLVKYGVSDLLPVQFHYLLNKSGLDYAIDGLLIELKSEDIEKYALYKAYLTGARHYEFSKALGMYLDIKDRLIDVDPNLDFTVEQLKTMWLEAAKM